MRERTPIEYETAKLCNKKKVAVYAYNAYFKGGVLKDTRTTDSKGNRYGAPDQSVLQTTLREDYNLCVTVIRNSFYDVNTKFDCYNYEAVIHKDGVLIEIDEGLGSYDYESALELGLVAALTMIPKDLNKCYMCKLDHGLHKLTCGNQEHPQMKIPVSLT
mgnify:FL=1